jgi:hypothetical protein
MVESQIFWRGAMLDLWLEDGIPAVLIHDCLLVRERDAERSRQVILRHAAQVLGFPPYVRIKARHKH